jgi:hypothetical protein
VDSLNIARVIIPPGATHATGLMWSGTTSL